MALGTEAYALEGLFLVAPDGREKEVRAQIARPAFSRVADGIVRYIPYGEPRANREAILRFGSGMKAVQAISTTLIKQRITLKRLAAARRKYLRGRQAHSTAHLGTPQLPGAAENHPNNVERHQPATEAKYRNVREFEK